MCSRRNRILNSLDTRKNLHWKIFIKICVNDKLGKYNEYFPDFLILAYIDLKFD